MPEKDTSSRSGSTLPEKASTALNVVSTAGAILVVGLGLTFVFIIAVVALGTVPESQKAAVVTAALTVLGTIVGAYFGVKVGAAGREKAEAARDAEAVKVQELAAQVDPQQAKAALDTAERRIRTTKDTAMGRPATAR
jgi:threonine/homoserine/homoserine lactone efflux protein